MTLIYLKALRRVEMKRRREALEFRSLKFFAGSRSTRKRELKKVRNGK